MFEITSVLTAVLFMVSNLIGFAFLNRFRGHGHFSWKEYHALNTDLIQSEFENREDDYFFEISAAMLNSIAWMVFCVPLIQVAWIQSRQGTFLLETHTAIVVLALGGSITELVSRLLYIGTTATSNLLATKFNLENWINISGGDAQAAEDETVDVTAEDGDLIGWRVLEMIHIVMRGLTIWINSAEWLFLTGIFVLIYISVHKSDVPCFDRKWARLGMVIGMLAFVDFLSDITHLRYKLSLSKIAVGFTFISRAVLMPIWLVWLAQQLSTAQLKLESATTPSREVSFRDNRNNDNIAENVPDFS